MKAGAGTTNRFVNAKTAPAAKPGAEQTGSCLQPPENQFWFWRFYRLILFAVDVQYVCGDLVATTCYRLKPTLKRGKLTMTLVLFAVCGNHLANYAPRRYL
jgi:hypothetical protein